MDWAVRAIIYFQLLGVIGIGLAGYVDRIGRWPEGIQAVSLVAYLGLASMAVCPIGVLLVLRRMNLREAFVAMLLTVVIDSAGFVAIIPLIQ